MILHHNTKKYQKIVLIMFKLKSIISFIIFMPVNHCLGHNGAIRQLRPQSTKLTYLTKMLIKFSSHKVM